MRGGRDGGLLRASEGNDHQKQSTRGGQSSDLRPAFTHTQVRREQLSFRCFYSAAGESRAKAKDRQVRRSCLKKCRPCWKGSPIGLKSRCRAKPLFPWFSISLGGVTYSEGPTLHWIAIVPPKLSGYEWFIYSIIRLQ